MCVFSAWDRNITGRGVGLLILDDGVDYTHPDLAPAYSPAASWGDSRPAAARHGTLCAGLAAARSNDHCIVGIAPAAPVAVPTTTTS